MNGWKKKLLEKAAFFKNKNLVKNKRAANTPPKNPNKKSRGYQIAQ